MTEQEIIIELQKNIIDKLVEFRDKDTKEIIQRAKISKANANILLNELKSKYRNLFTAEELFNFFQQAILELKENNGMIDDIGYFDYYIYV